MLLFTGGSTRAQFAYRHLTTKDGLIQGTVEYFMEDSRGFLWMTTQAGLNRFDGQSFKSFTHNDQDERSIGKGQLNGLVEAPDGDIWVGTEVCVSRYVRKTNKFENYYFRDKNGKRQFSHHYVIYADDSTVWYLNNPEGVVILNYETGRKSVLIPEKGFRFESPTQIADYDPIRQILWLKQPVGFLRYDCRTKKREYFFTGRPADKVRGRLEISAMYSTNHESFWLSTNQGLMNFQQDRLQRHEIGIDFVDDPVYSMRMDNAQNLWITTSKNGMVVYDTKRQEVIHKLTSIPFQPNSLIHNHLSNVFIDSRGTAWANVDPQSVDVIFPVGRTPMRFSDNPLNPDDLNTVGIRGISVDLDGNLWVGTIGEGVRRFSPDFKTVRAYRTENGLLQNNVRDVLTDSRGDVWFCTKEGLNVMRRGQDKLESFTLKGQVDPVAANYAKGIEELPGGRYVVATMSGLFLMNGDGSHKLLADAGDAFSGEIYFDKKTNLLYAGRADQDLRCYQLAGDQVHLLYSALQGYNVLSVLPDGDMLWVATDNGLVHFDLQKRKIRRVFGVRDGLPDPVTYSVLPDGRGNFWISTNKGIAIFDRKKFRRIRHTESIEFNSFANLRTGDGKMFFGSVEGLFYIDPVAFDRPSARGLRFSHLAVNDSLYFDLDTKQQSDIVLEHNQNNLIFEMSVLDYISQVPPRYDFRIVRNGKIGKWLSNESEPLIKLFNSERGIYRLDVRALDANGFMTEVKSVHYTILPPFWETWWFRSLAFVIFGWLLLLLVRYYLRTQQLAERRLTDKIIEAQEMERLRMSRDIHDDVNNTLAAAKGYLQNFESDTVADLTDNAARSSLLIQKATEDLRNITHNLRPVEFERFSLSEVIGQRVSEWNDAGELFFDYIVAGEIQKLAPQSEQMIYRIVTECVQNIRKHSKASTAVIQLVYQDEQLVVSLEDDGVGFDGSRKNENKEDGIGLKNLYSRAQYIQAVLEINSDETGVLIQLTVPYAYNSAHSSHSG